MWSKKVDLNKTFLENGIENRSNVVLWIDNSSDDSYQNYIIAEYIIQEKDINKNIQIIYSYEAYQKSINKFEFAQEFSNEKDIRDCLIEIGNNIVPFSYIHTFENIGKYKIKYSFNKKLKNISYLFFNCLNII